MLGIVCYSAIALWHTGLPDTQDSPWITVQFLKTCTYLSGWGVSLCFSPASKTQKLPARGCHNVMWRLFRPGSLTPCFLQMGGVWVSPIPAAPSWLLFFSFFPPSTSCKSQTWLCWLWFPLSKHLHSVVVEEQQVWWPFSRCCWNQLGSQVLLSFLTDQVAFLFLDFGGVGCWWWPSKKRKVHICSAT